MFKHYLNQDVVDVIKSTLGDITAEKKIMATSNLVTVASPAVHLDMRKYTYADRKTALKGFQLVAGILYREYKQTCLAELQKSDALIEKHRDMIFDIYHCVAVQSICTSVYFKHHDNGRYQIAILGQDDDDLNPLVATYIIDYDKL